MRDINWIPVTKEYWLRNLPKTIQVLSGKYHFYWSQLCHHVNNPEVTIKKKKDWYKGRLALYVTKEELYFFVVYCKDKIDVYYLEDSYIETKGQRDYFIKNWKKFFEYDNDEFFTI